jgi:hypothetical protein
MKLFQNQEYPFSLLLNLIVKCEALTFQEGISTQRGKIVFVI